MARLTLNLLGPFEATLDGAPVAFRYDKLRALLAYLAVEAGRAHRRDALAGLLWPELPDPDARRNLSQALFNLRQSLGEAGDGHAQPYLLVTRDSLQFNAESDHALDAAEFERLLLACDRHTHASAAACHECAARRECALGLYRGPFLQQFFVGDSAGFEEWALLRREALQRDALAALQHQAAYHEHGGDYTAAHRWVARLLALEPWREEAHRDAMRLLALAGQRSAALAQYETCRKVLADELGVEPAPETQALYAHIKSGAFPGPAAPARAEPPAEAAGPAARAPLPLPLTPFVGRARELAELGRLLAEPECRLLTLAGPGGIGKTRLALQAAADHQGLFAHGVAFVPLVPITAPQAVAPAVAAALGLPAAGHAEPGDRLAHYLRDRRLLLVLDGFEHLLAQPASASLVSDLLRAAPALKVLVTSREALGLQGEWVFEVDGLGDDAAALFVQSARRARAGFVLQPDDQAAVRRICRLVAELPLAVELAAAWARVLSCAEIAEEIERAFTSGERLDILTASARDVPERHRSLTAVFDHSWRLLSPEEQHALCRLAAFRGGFAREAAEHVAGASLSLLSSLVSKSLLRRAGSGRYDLHELVRQYARQKQAQAQGGLAAAQAAHSAYFVRYLSERTDALRGPRQRQALLDIAAEWTNVGVAWQRALERHDLAVLRGLLPAVYMFAQRKGRYREVADWLERTIAAVEAGAPSPEQTELLAMCLQGLAWLSIRLGRLEQAEALFQRGQTYAGQLGRPLVSPYISDALTGRGLIAFLRGDYEAAIALLEAARDFQQTHGHPQLAVYPSLFLASVARAQGDGARAQHFAEEAHTLAKTLDHPWVTATVHSELGHVAYLRGAADAARGHYHASYVIREELGDPDGMALALAQLGSVALLQHDYAEARGCYERSLALYHELGDRTGLAGTYVGLGRAALGLGDHAAARLHLSQAVQQAGGRQGQAAPVLLDGLAGFGQLLAQQGEVQRAAVLLAMVAAHPAATHETRLRAQHWLAHCQGQLAPDDFARALQHAAESDPAAAAASLAADPAAPA